MLKLCGIEQADWHSKQILCVPRGDAMTEQTPTFNYEMVLIDFGFAYQRLHGEDYGLPPTKDVLVPQSMLASEVHISSKVLPKHWPSWDYMDDEF